MIPFLTLLWCFSFLIWNQFLLEVENWQIGFVLDVTRRDRGQTSTQILKSVNHPILNNDTLHYQDLSDNLSYPKNFGNGESNHHLDIGLVQNTEEHNSTEAPHVERIHPQLPNFEKGGLVIFYHVAKTGGSTIRAFFKKKQKRYGRSKFSFSRWKNNPDRNETAKEIGNSKFGNETTFIKCTPKGAEKDRELERVNSLITPILKSDQSIETIMIEIHGESMGLMELSKWIQRWRELCKESGKQFFAFTLLRDPIPFSVSYFKYFHLNCTYSWCEQTQYEEPSEVNLLDSLIPDRQCFLLTHTSSIGGMHPSFYQKCQVDKERCDDTYKVMKENLDWIGTTERISEDTIPLLSYILNRENNFIETKSKKVAKELDFEQNMSKNYISKIHSMTENDQFMYDRVRREYSIDNMFPEL